MAFTVASSASVTIRGVATTGTSPVPSASAVSPSATSSSTAEASPGRNSTGVPETTPGGGPLIDTPVLERTLAAALRHGGDFAEVFAEDRRTASARLDDGRVEEFLSGRDRGAGVRVVRGATPGSPHPPP